MLSRLKLQESVSFRATLEGLVGSQGKIWGLPSFGFSAPYKVLDEKLGFTAENIYKQVKSML